MAIGLVPVEDPVTGSRPAFAGDTEDVLERAFGRITGSQPRTGNAVRLLKDASENYPAWMAAIRAAQSSIYFENYIIADDATGQRFMRALAERARSGVRVLVLYDWFGSRSASAGLWADLTRAGAEVRAFNPPSIASPLAWLRRDHRKVLVVDERVGFVSGLCVANDWVGDPQKGLEPWRDTGVELRGPVVADLAAAFFDTWREAGEASTVGFRETDAGSDSGVLARIVPGRPGNLVAYRLDQFVASAARQSLWLTDPYFVATTAYVLALTAAARDGVDVRLLVPRLSDLPVVRSITRVGYRPLLAAGIRIFEWNGTMLHAKTAVVDGNWSRIGSTNLNLASWLVNWELDVTIADAGFAQSMSDMYLRDLENSTEIVQDLKPTRSIRPRGPRDAGSHRGSASRLAAGAVGLTSTAGAAVMAARSLSSTEAKALAGIGSVLVIAAVLAAVFPLVVVLPLAVLSAWVGISLLVRAWRLRRA